jgi:hypothetical protein
MVNLVESLNGFTEGTDYWKRNIFMLEHDGIH